jgi:uncharacterized protein with NRDE domain
MCTLIALWQCHPSAPVVLALNRDEFLERPTAPFSLWENLDPPGRLVSGRDLQAGGTWFGVGERVAAALTNHRIGGRSRPGQRSRGELVTRALCAPDLDSVAREFAMLPAMDYGSFHLLATDGRAMIWITNREDRMELHPVEPGIHVMGNYGLDNEKDPVVVNVASALEGVGSLSTDALQGRLTEVLSRRGDGWPCVDLGIYGTRSSSMLWWGGPTPRLIGTDGSPDRNVWQDRTELLAALTEARTAAPIR